MCRKELTILSSGPSKFKLDPKLDKKNVAFQILYKLGIILSNMDPAGVLCIVFLTKVAYTKLNLISSMLKHVIRSHFLTNNGQCIKGMTN